MPATMTRLAHAAAVPVRLSPPPLRTADGHNREERRASWLELFFDLVFAGAVGQLAGALQEHLSLGTLARFVLLFTPIWWLWVQFSFYADRHESDDGIPLRVPCGDADVRGPGGQCSPGLVRPDHRL